MITEKDGMENPEPGGNISLFSPASWQEGSSSASSLHLCLGYFLAYLIASVITVFIPMFVSQHTRNILSVLHITNGSIIMLFLPQILVHLTLFVFLGNKLIISLIVLIFQLLGTTHAILETVHIHHLTRLSTRTSRRRTKHCLIKFLMSRSMGIFCMAGLAIFGFYCFEVSDEFEDKYKLEQLNSTDHAFDNNSYDFR